MKKILFVVLLAMAQLKVQSQLNFGQFNTPFAGVNAMGYNPAEIVDSRYKFHLNLFDLGFAASNNFVGASKDLVTTDQPVINDSNRKQYYIQNLDGAQKSGYAQVDVKLMNLMFQLSNKHSIGFSFGTKAFATVDGVSEKLAKFSYDSKDASTYGVNNNTDMGVNATAWNYFGITYGRQLFNKGKHYLKFAVTVKANFGIGNEFVKFGNNTYVNILDRNNLQTANGNFTTGFGSAYLDNKDKNSFQVGFNNVGFGTDIGFIYEKRDGKDYTYTMDCITGRVRNDLNKYKYRIGFSVSDLGFVPFQRYTALKSVSFDSTLFNVTEFNVFKKAYQGSNFKDSLNSIAAYDGLKIDTSKESYNVMTPATFNMFFDYRIWKGFYVAANASLSFVANNSTASLVRNSFVSVVPRFDAKVLGIYLPISYGLLAKEVNVGVGMRLGPINFAVQDILWAAKAKSQTKNFAFNIGINIPILNKKRPKDDDNDLISNKKDKCKDIPGDCINMGCPEPDEDMDSIPDKDDKCPKEKGLKELGGCPDTDGDGVPNKIDKCPKDFGPKETYGCPDTDKDGVIDKDDKCPEKYGRKQYNGCPDTDEDGVPDNIDKCVDTPGVVENDGCPIVKAPDTDNDGVVDSIDKCLTVPGPLSNNGCPEIKITEEKKLTNFAQDNLEFKTGSAEIKKSSLLALNLVAEYLIRNPSSRLKLSGHTDNVGKAEKNLKLSIERAFAVKSYFVIRGVSSEKIDAEGFGMERPIGDNDTESGRKLNRRVEIEIIK